MEKVALTKSELFVDFFKTEKSLIKFDEIKSHLEKSMGEELEKSKRFTGVPLNHNVNIQWLFEYVKDRFTKFTFPNQINISPMRYELLLTKPGELHPTIYDIDKYNLYGSPDYTILYGLNGTSEVTLFYDDHRHICKTWNIPLEKDKFIMFNSSIKYQISPNKSNENRFIIKVKSQQIT